MKNFHIFHATSDVIAFQNAANQKFKSVQILSATYFSFICFKMPQNRQILVEEIAVLSNFQ